MSSLLLWRSGRQTHVVHPNVACAKFSTGSTCPLIHLRWLQDVSLWSEVPVFWNYHRSTIWNALWRHCDGKACQTSEPLGNSVPLSRGFQTSRDLSERPFPLGRKRARYFIDIELIKHWMVWRWENIEWNTCWCQVDNTSICDQSWLILV